MSLHKEISFETEICQHLAAHGWLYGEGDAAGYDRARALFPARRITTGLSWEDLILAPSTMAGVDEIRTWGQHGSSVQEEWGLGKHLKPGLQALFSGPPGTGKTLTACLLGQALGLDVYRIDLSQAVSKYIGETEKNLDRLMDQASKKNWLLLFDEADALIGKRSDIRDAHDRYANMQTSYLLRRIEDFPGIVILATNSNADLDDAFLRRLRFVVEFPMPGHAERLRLWQRTFPEGVSFEKGVDFLEIAREHPLTGGQIVNVVRYCALMSIERGDKVIRLEDILGGIRREFTKEGRGVAAVEATLPPS